MYIFVVVNGVGDLPHGSFEVPLLTLSADHETDLATGVSRDGSEGIFGNSVYFSGGLFQLLDQRSMQPEAFGLSGYVTSGIKGVVKEPEVRFLEEGSSGTDGIRRVGDDDIIRRGVFRQELEAIPNMHKDFWVREQFRHMGEEPFGDTDHSLQSSQDRECLENIKFA